MEKLLTKIEKYILYAVVFLFPFFVLAISPNPFVDPAGIQLKNDSKLTLGVAFSNASSNWLENLEGSALLYLAPEED